MKKKESFSYEIKDVIGMVKESSTSNWGKGVVRMQYDNMPETIDFRKLDPVSEKIGSGISFFDDEIETIVDLLLDSDFGSLDKIEEALARRKSRFTQVEPNLVVELDEE